MAKQTEPAATFDLDNLEHPDPPDAPPFAVTLGAKTYTLMAPTEVDAQDLLASYEASSVGNIIAAVRLMLDPEDRDEFFSNRLPMWKLSALFDAYNEHYRLDPGEASASPSS